MNMRAIITYLLAATAVVVLGSLAGWYFFLRGQSQATTTADTARGFSVSAPYSSQIGSTYQNMLSGISDAIRDASGARASGPLTRLWHADKSSVAGFAFSSVGSTTRLQFVERGSGYVFAADPTTQTIVRRTNTLLPKTYEALFVGNDGVIERTVDPSGAISTFSGKIATSSISSLNASSTPTALEGVYVNKNIRTLAVHPTTGELFYLMGSLPEISGVRAQWDGGKQKTVFSTVVPDWRAWWLSDGRIVLLTSPVDGAPGYSYVLGADGALQPLLRALPGLTILPRASDAKTSSSVLLYGISTGSGISLFARVNADASPVTFPVHTIAEKCVWAPGKELIVYCGVPQVPPAGTYLNDRYKGVAHTADSWWRLNVSTGQAELIYAPDQSLRLDVEAPTIDQSGAYLAFKNAADGSLWVLRIVQ